MSNDDKTALATLLVKRNSEIVELTEEMDKFRALTGRIIDYQVADMASQKEELKKLTCKHDNAIEELATVKKELAVARALTTHLHDQLSLPQLMDLLRAEVTRMREFNDAQESAAKRARTA
jgi:sulfite reductase alpha subunit-like flavoprotein